MKRFLLIVPVLLLAAWAAAPIASAQHAEIGAYGDYVHLGSIDTNMVGLGSRVGVDIVPDVMLEGQISYDFDQTFSEGFTNTSGGTVGFSNSGIKVLDGLFGPKIETRGPVKFFVTVKGGFINFRLSGVPGSFSGFTSSVSNLRGSNVDGMLYPGAGMEATIGPVGLRLDVGDDIYFTNRAYHNFAVQFGPVFRF
jgi:hypothetical protein